jgi:hypothetical protein
VAAFADRRGEAFRHDLRGIGVADDVDVPSHDRGDVPVPSRENQARQGRREAAYLWYAAD